MKLFTVASSTPSPQGEGWGEAVTEFQSFIHICRTIMIIHLIAFRSISILFGTAVAASSFPSYSNEI